MANLHEVGDVLRCTVHQRGFLSINGYDVTCCLYEVGMMTFKQTEKYLMTKVIILFM